jgi:hypothetical protein
MKCVFHQDKEMAMGIGEGNESYQDIMFLCPEGCRWKTRLGLVSLIPATRTLPDAAWETAEAAKLSICEHGAYVERYFD